MIELRGVWKKSTDRRRKNLWLVAGADAVLPRGRRIALIGPDAGENKAVLRMLAGLIPPDEGVIVRTGLICLPFTETSFLDYKSSFKQNANFIGLLYGFDPREVEAAALQISGLRIREKKPLSILTSAERIQAALGFLLAIPFDWYFIHETIPRVPPNMIDSIEGAIAERVSRGSVVWATTKPEFVSDYCDAALVLNSGRLDFYDDIDEACAVHKHASKASVGVK